MQDVLKLYQTQLGPLSSSQRDRLYQAREEGMSPFVIGCAILRASQERRLAGGTKRITFNYVTAILDDWLTHGITDEKAFRAYYQDRPTAKRAERGAARGHADSPRKFARTDFKYTKPEPAKKGTFSFLDD